MPPRFLIPLLLLAVALHASPRSLVFEPAGPSKGKHIVFLSGDEEYRSEQSMPMLAKILSQRHGFKCTVLFALDPDGTVNPDNIRSLSDPAALDTADLIVMAIRWRDYPDDQMKHFVDAYLRGVPIIGLRTSTHAFRPKQGAYLYYEKFGKYVFGEEWVDHWGRHKSEASRAVMDPSAQNNPILNSVHAENIFTLTDVYEVYPPADVTVLLRGRVLSGMTPDSPPADHSRRRSSDHQEQPINDPMMPVAWTRVHHNPAGHDNKVLLSTMGAAVDLQNEDLRRLLVNGVYWALGLEVPAHADVDYVDGYEPRMFGSTAEGFRRGTRPDDYDLGKTIR